MSLDGIKGILGLTTSLEANMMIDSSENRIPLSGEDDYPQIFTDNGGVHGVIIDMFNSNGHGELVTQVFLQQVDIEEIERQGLNFSIEQRDQSEHIPTILTDLIHRATPVEEGGLGEDIDFVNISLSRAFSIEELSSATGISNITNENIATLRPEIIERLEEMAANNITDTGISYVQELLDSIKAIEHLEKLGVQVYIAASNKRTESHFSSGVVNLATLASGINVVAECDKNKNLFDRTADNSLVNRCENGEYTITANSGDNGSRLVEGHHPDGEIILGSSYSTPTAIAKDINSELLAIFSS